LFFKKKNDPKTIRSWCLYDWANSVYSLIITSTLFPVYYGIVAKNETGGNSVSFFGIEILNSALFSFAISFSFLVSALLSPFLSAVADLTGYRRRFLLGFCLIGSLACAALFGFGRSNLEFGILTFILAAVGYSSSIVFYNSFLPNIASPDKYAAVSARGFSLGYAGSVLLLLLILTPVFLPNIAIFQGITFEKICRIGFVLTGIWWFSFGFISVSGLPKSEKEIGFHFKFKAVLERLKVAMETVKIVKGLNWFLLGFFFINTGVQTVMYMAAIFGDIELHLSSDKLILTILILQLVAIFGAYLFSKISEKTTDATTLILACLLWIVVCFAAFFVQTDMQFFGVAALVGLVMGGSQSMLRSTFTHFLPNQEHGKSAMYGLYDLLDKFSIVLGTLVFGLTNQLLGNMRASALALIIFFVFGAIFIKKMAKT
jgi:UMF1 family MFS transporter